MATHDLENKVSVAASLNPAARTASANGTAVDLQGFNSAMLVVQFGAYTDGTHTPNLEHSVDGVSYAACDANSLNGTLVAVSSGAGAGTVQKVGYTGGRRYVRAVMTVTGATTGALSAATIVRGHPAQAPV